MYYTIGQRKGLGIGGGFGDKEEPWFVADKDFDNNILIVAQGHNHPSLFHNKLVADQLHWISGLQPENTKKLSAKIRYRQKDQECRLSLLNNDECVVEFKNPQFAITPGQSVVFYDGEECLCLLYTSPSPRD